MKTQISDSGDYKVFVEVNEYLRSNGNVHVKFLTKWEKAKNPEEEQTKFQMILSPQELENLRSLLNGYKQEP